MASLMRATVVVLVLAGLAGLAFLGGRYWQEARPAYQRLAGPSECDLRAGPCVQPVGDGRLSFSITPATIPLMKTLELEVRTRGLKIDGVVVDIRGLNMDMGLNRTSLVRTADQVWRGETILPVCSQRRMMWEAAVQFDAQGHFEVPFPFETNRR